MRQVATIITPISPIQKPLGRPYGSPKTCWVQARPAKQFASVYNSTGSQLAGLLKLVRKGTLFRKVMLIVLLGLFLAACGGEPSATPTITSTPPLTIPVLSATPAVTNVPGQTPAVVEVSSDTPSPLPPTDTPLPTETATVTATAPPNDLAIATSGIILYPVPAIYAGDNVTFQLAAHLPDPIAPREVGVQILIDGRLQTEGTLGWRNLGGEAMGLFEWAWNTAGQPGSHQVTVVLDPTDAIQVGDEISDNNVASLAVEVLPAEALPLDEAGATWAVLPTACCNVHTISGTAANRDLAQLGPMVDAAFGYASARLAEQPNQRFDVYLIDRVIGQGGYASNIMVISYLDRDYAGGGLYEVLVHEAVHLIDRQFAPNRISFMAEGMAVWATGGHYKQENIDERVAAMVDAGMYVPLADLLNSFYPTQHEIGYLEAAGLIGYLARTYGWDQVRTFYTNTNTDDAPTMAEVVDRNLQLYFGQTLAQVEQSWLAYLAGLRPGTDPVTDLQTTLRFYDVMRQYQVAYDPTAYFLQAWLPPAQEAEKRGITADFNRHPEAEINITLEIMLQAANDALLQGDYNRANVLLNSVSRVLERGGSFIDPLALHYLNIVRTAAATGYEAQAVALDGTQAIVLANRQDGREGPSLTELTLILNDQTWVLAR